MLACKCRTNKSPSQFQLAKTVPIYFIRHFIALLHDQTRLLAIKNRFIRLQFDEVYGGDHLIFHDVSYLLLSLLLTRLLRPRKAQNYPLAQNLGLILKCSPGLDA